MKMEKEKDYKHSVQIMAKTITKTKINKTCPELLWRKVNNIIKEHNRVITKSHGK